MRTGGQILIDQLALNGVQRIFMVPGESFLPALDALHDSSAIDIVVCRHESGAAMMAEAAARLEIAAGTVTPDGRKAGGVGVVFVTRGPGLANAMSGMHAAMQASTPLLVLAGLPPQSHLGRDAFQEVDVERLAGGGSGGFAKWAATVRDAARIPELVAHAIVTARSGRAGPVVLGLPEDVLSASSDAADASAVRIAEAGPTWIALSELASAINNAEWPLIIAGGGGWTRTASHELQRFAERLDLPVAAAFRSQDVIDNRSPSYVGHAGIGIDAKLAAAIRHADLIIALGTRLDEITSGRYGLLTPPTPRQNVLVHVHPDAGTIGANIRASLPIISTPAHFAAHLDDLMPSIRRGMPQRWSALRRDLRGAFEAWQNFSPSPGAVRLETVVRHLSAALPEDAIVTSGAGNYAGFVHRAFIFKGGGTQLAPPSGSMGYGLPAAVAAKLAHPERDVVCFAGDGCFQMSSGELATAAQYGLAILIVIANNAMFGTIRFEQERRYPGRVVATSLVNPDFVALARSYGAYGERITDDSEIAGAIARARDAKRPAVLEIAVDAQAVAPGVSLDRIRGTHKD